MKRITLAAALGALLFVAPACSEAEAATVAGTYSIDADATAKAMAKSMGKEADQATIDMMKKLMGGASMTLNADGTFTGSAEMMGQKQTNKGTWSIKEGALTMAQTHQDDKEAKQDATGSIKDGVLTCTMKKDGKDQTMIFKKAEAKK